MPRHNVDYSKTLIYKLVHKDDFENANIYIGSTTDFRKRKNSHKIGCNNPNDRTYNRKVYESIRSNEGWENWVMIEVEKYPCMDKREADGRERYWLEYYKSKLNMLIPGRTDKEYYKDNKENILAIQKIYREKNLEKALEYIRGYREKNKEKLSDNKRRYYEKNKEPLLKKP